MFERGHVDRQGEYGEVNQYLTLEETNDAYETLGAAAWGKIQRAATILTGSEAAGRELAQDAIARAIIGDRQCPRDVDLVAFTVMVMKSILSSAAKSAKRSKRVPLDAVGDGQLLEAVQRAGQQTAEELLCAEEEDQLFCQRVASLKQQVLTLFDDDDTTRIIVEGIMEGMEGAALRDLVAIDAKELATRRRLIRRRIDKAFPNGWLA